jgi:uncharacterized protein
MPYHISDQMSECAGWAVVKDANSEIVGCHKTRDDALTQLAALHIAEPNMRSVATTSTSTTGTVSISISNGVNMPIEQELRELPPSYRPASSDDVPISRPMCGSCEYFCVVLDEAGVAATHCSRWDAAVEADQYCDAYEPKEDQGSESDMGEMPDMGEMEMDSAPINWLSVSEDDRRSVVYSNLEVRAAGEGNTIIGYAAIFDSPSVDMGFTEFVTRGAFTKTLKDGADVRLLLDHEGAPLARTKSGTLRLSEDDRGLRIEADLDPANPLAQTVLSALRRGDMNQMSFAFRTIRDSWNSDRSVRELREVQLYDVSVVTFPAYEATVAEVRARSSATIPSESRTRLRKAQIQIAKSI